MYSADYFIFLVRTFSVSSLRISSLPAEKKLICGVHVIWPLDPLTQKNQKYSVRWGDTLGIDVKFLCLSCFKNFLCMFEAKKRKKKCFGPDNLLWKKYSINKKTRGQYLVNFRKIGWLVFELSCTPPQEKAVSRKWRLKFGKNI